MASSERRASTLRKDGCSVVPCGLATGFLILAPSVTYFLFALRKAFPCATLVCVGFMGTQVFAQDSYQVQF